MKKVSKQGQGFLSFLNNPKNRFFRGENPNYFNCIFRLKTIVFLILANLGLTFSANAAYDITIVTPLTCGWSVEVYDNVGNLLGTYTAAGSYSCQSGTACFLYLKATNCGTLQIPASGSGCFSGGSYTPTWSCLPSATCPGGPVNLNFSAGTGCSSTGDDINISF